MASFEPIDHFEGLEIPPPRPTTPPVRRGFLVVLAGLMLAAAAVYGIPYVAYRAGYNYEAGRSKAAYELLTRLDKQGAISNASALFRSATTAVAPAVANIMCYKQMNFQRPGPNGIAPMSGLIRSSVGSGVVIDKQRGHIVTNGHVVEGADEIKVRIGRGPELTATLVGADSKTDLAVLRVPGPLGVEVPWADSESVDVGDWVLAIGSPFELDQSVTAGIVSAIGRKDLRIVGDGGGYEDFIQTDAPINPGNSGGPLVDLRGRVVGINTAIYAPKEPDGSGDGRNSGIGFAISANLARNVVDQIIKNGRVVRGYLGVVLGDVDPEQLEQLKLPEARGAVIIDVDPEGPADKGGLKPGDVVIDMGGKAIENLSDLRSRTASLPAGTAVPLTFVRDGQKQTAEVQIAELPVLRSLGLRLREVSAQGQTGVFIDQVMPGSPAARVGLRPGMRIAGIANRPIRHREEANSMADRLDPKQGIPLQVQTPDGQIEEILLGGPRRR